MKAGQRVRVTLGNGHFHIGEYLKKDELGAHLIGVLETSIPGVTKKPGRKFISVFYADPKQISEAK
jgi:hypothetical protein